MLSEHRRRKMRRYFSANDANGDGILEASDVEQNVKNLAALRGIAPDSAEFATMREVYLRGIQVAPGARVDLEQFYQLVEQLSSDTPEAMAFLTSNSDSSFTVMDHNKDNRISLPEYLDFLKAHGCDSPQAPEHFRRMDSDSDGFLSREEFRQHMIEFVKGEDVNAPGTHFLGPID